MSQDQLWTLFGYTITLAMESQAILQKIVIGGSAQSLWM